MPSQRSPQILAFRSKYPPINERHFEILPVDTTVWIRIDNIFEQRRGLVPETYYVQQGRMGSDGLPEYRLRAANGQPVYERLRLKSEDERDSWYKGYQLQECNGRLDENEKTRGKGKIEVGF